MAAEPIEPLLLPQSSNVWAHEEGFIEHFPMHRAVSSYFRTAFVKRCCSQTCFCLSNPVTGVLWSLFPCIFGPINEICCAYSVFLQRNVSREVALTDRGITVKTLRAAKKQQRRYRYQDSPTARFHSPQLGMYALDQFSIDREWELPVSTNPTDSLYDTRRIYYDQIRSASIVQGAGMRVNCACFCCCGFQHTDSRIRFVRIDIGRDDKVDYWDDLDMQNPILVGLNDAERFCAEVNARARGGRSVLHGETKVVDVVPVPIASQAIPSAPEAPTMSRIEDQETLLSEELTRLADLFHTGALSADEFQNSKDACIKRCSR